MSVTDQLSQLLEPVLLELDLNSVLSEPLHWEHPTEPKFGDYSTNVAMKLFSQLKAQDHPVAAQANSPRALAQLIVDRWQALELDTTLVQSMSVAGPGFINIFLSPSFLLQQVSMILDQPLTETIKATHPDHPIAVIEYMQPNTNKPLHVGHLRNAVLGMAVTNLLEAVGWRVHRATINNDRGLHIIKSMWGYLAFGRSQDHNQTPWQELLTAWLEKPESWTQPSEMEEARVQKPDHFVGAWYVKADAFAEDPSVTEAWKEMLLAWENPADPQHAQVRLLWQRMNAWFYEGYEQSAKRLGVVIDPEHISYESDIYEAGRQIIVKAAEQGIFRRLENGAIEASLEERFGLPNKVLLRGDGTGIYMTFDIELTRRRAALRADKSVWVVGSDQKLYFDQLFAVCELLGIGKRSDYHHFAYGMVRLAEGKMSSRKGRVIYSDDVVDLAVARAKEIMSQTGAVERLSLTELDSTAELVGVAAVKWSMLAQDPLSELTFDLQKSVSFEGFAGPYIQYTAVRCHSLLQKAQITEKRSLAKQLDTFINNKVALDTPLSETENDVVRNLYVYFEAIESAAAEMAPHHVATYLFGLSQSFNAMYAGTSIVDESDVDRRAVKLAIVAAVGAVLQHGLNVLGITAVEKM